MDREGQVAPSVMAALRGWDARGQAVVEVDLERPDHLAALMRLAHKTGTIVCNANGELVSNKSASASTVMSAKHGVIW